LSKQAIEQVPNESCALLFGKTENDQLVVKDLFLTENTEKSPVNFTISNEQLIQGYQEAEEKKLEVIGIFHSHPNSEPYPSNTDKKFMKINPVVWVIFSCLSKNFQAYTLDSEIIEIPIVTA
ncbi:MAG: M67 family metallopeptidase, partial [Nitrosopumilaceae archaeon]